MSGAMATLFAAAHQRVNGARAAAHRGNGVFWLPGLGPERSRTIEVDSAEALVAAAPALSSTGEVEMRFTLDPDQPVESFVPPPPAPDDNWVEPAEDTVEAVRDASNFGPAVRAGRGGQRSVPACTTSPRRPGSGSSTPGVPRGCSIGAADTIWPPWVCRQTTSP